MENKFLKLTNAVYKILEFFPESDPLKHRARDKVLAIFENLSLLDVRPGWAVIAEVLRQEKIKMHISEDIDVLLGYLWIGKTQGWLNSVNCMIISNEYEKIKEGITLTKETKSDVIDEPKSFDELEITAIKINKDSDSGTAKEEKPGASVKNSSSNIALSERQKQIINYLSKNNRGQVMDLQTVLPNVTKRTIRRDLDELLKFGKVTRRGDFNQIFYTIKQ